MVYTFQSMPLFIFLNSIGICCIGSLFISNFSKLNLLSLLINLVKHLLILLIFRRTNPSLY